MEAINPEAGSESTSIQEDSQTLDGTADAATEQGEPLDDQPEGPYNDDLSDVPEEHREWHQTEGNKRIQRWITKNAQGKAAEYQTLQQQYEKTSGDYESLVGEIKQVLSDPSKLDQYRRQLGYDVEPEAPPEFNTVEDLVGWQKSQIAQLRQEMQAQSGQQVQQHIQKNNADMRYQQALVQSKTDPFFTHNQSFIEAMVADAITNPNSPHRDLKGKYNGANELEVLQAATAKFRNHLNPLFDQVKQEASQTITKKQASTTFAPQKSVSKTETSQRTNRSADEIVADLKRRGLAY